ncbi:MAG: fimbrillin family protein [Bacteroidales bacterium]|nr:fimbrillin family protein [Bacteroidales bacterium]
MKKRIILLFLLPAFLWACTRETQEWQRDVSCELYRFDAAIVSPEAPSQADGRKTHLGEKNGTSYPNYWSAGDAIAINGFVSEALADDSPYVGTNHASFTVKGVLNVPYRCLYPASALTQYSGGSASVFLPYSQRWSSSTYDHSAFLMAGSSNGFNLSFSCLMSAIKLTVPGNYDAKLSSVMFEALGSEKVSGAFTTDFSSLTPASGASSLINIPAPDGGVDFGSSVYFLIPAQTYSGGMRFTIRATDGTQMSYSTSKSFTMAAGKSYTLTTSNYTPDAAEEPTGMMVMSSNVRFASARGKSSNPDTGDRDWTNRKTAYYAMVNSIRPAVIGLQEAEKEQVKDIKANCSGYAHYGLGREGGRDIVKDGSWFSPGTDDGDESTTILYRTDLITLNSSGTVWLSDTPSKVNSYFPEMEDSQCRTATWAVLTYKPSGKQFFFLNTHTSLYGDSRPKEVQVVLNTVSQKNTSHLPVILTADWNLEEDHETMSPITSAYESARRTAWTTDFSETFHWWGTKSQLIDHIFYDGIAACPLFHTVAQKWNGMFISDHYPIYAYFDLDTDASGAPKADFDLPDGYWSDTLVFTDRSTAANGIVCWIWNIDGIISYEQNPRILFGRPRENVPVRLTVIDATGQKATQIKFYSTVSREEKYIGEADKDDYNPVYLFE